MVSQEYILTVVAAGLVAYVVILVCKGLAKSFQQHQAKQDPWWWQWGWRAASLLVGCGVGSLLQPWPWGAVLGLIGGGFATWIVRTAKRVVKQRLEDQNGMD